MLITQIFHDLSYQSVNFLRRAVRYHKMGREFDLNDIEYKSGILLRKVVILVGRIIPSMQIESFQPMNKQALLKFYLRVTSEEKGFFKKLNGKNFFEILAQVAASRGFGKKRIEFFQEKVGENELISAEQHRDIVEWINENKAKALCDAIANGEIEVVREVLSDGPPLTRKEKSKVLRKAALLGCSEVIYEFLVEDPTAFSSMAIGLALYNAVKKEHYQIVKNLFLFPSSGGIPLDLKRMSLNMAVSLGDERVVETLLCFLHLPEKDIERAFIESTKLGNLEMVRAILLYHFRGANNALRATLELAKKLGHKEIVALIEERMVDCEIQKTSCWCF